jgi:hypothetical protein
MPSEAILEAVQRTVRSPAAVLPPFLAPGEHTTAARIGFKEHFADLRAVTGYEGEPPVARFVRRLEAIGGRSFEITHATAAEDVVVIRSPLGVADPGAVWLSEADLVGNASRVPSRHLVVLLDPAAIVPTMHDAYARIFLAGGPSGGFMPRPSATGAIGGVIVHGIRAARSLTVLLSPERTP